MAGVLWAQLPFRQYPGVEYTRFETPPDWHEETEWSCAADVPPAGTRTAGDLTAMAEGLSLWTQDYPRADRISRKRFGV